MRIGIIGGGQLAKMMCESSPEHEYFVLEKSKNNPCKEVATTIVGDYSDVDKLNELKSLTDVITYEFENVPSSSIEVVKEVTFPNPKILEISQNRLVEKDMAKKLGLATPVYFAINSLKDLEEGLKELGGNGVLKTTTGGYDGKGQSVIKDFVINDNAKQMIEQTECILEELIDLDAETSVVATRDKFGRVVVLPLCNNTHKDGILYSTRTDFKTRHKPALVEATKKLMDGLEIVGTLAIEFFISKKRWVFNELAPRPHNSGHWSIEGCTVSQFRNHILAVTGEHIERPLTQRPTVMINLLGKDLEIVKNMDLPKGAYVHDYLKDKVVDKRKMGHVTISCDTYKEVEAIENQIENALGGNNE